MKIIVLEKTCKCVIFNYSGFQPFKMGDNDPVTIVILHNVLNDTLDSKLNQKLEEIKNVIGAVAEDNR